MGGFIFYGYFRNTNFKSKRLLDFAFVFLLASIICGLLGNLVWENGTLDYIYLKPLFIFDLKDLYNNCFVVLFCIFAVKNNKEIRKMKLKDAAIYFENTVFKKGKK